MQSGKHGMYIHAAKVWCMVAPPKVEMLVWFMVLGKLNTKDHLAWLNIINNDTMCCVLCNNHEESIEHLFFSCKYAWQLWCTCFKKWMVNWAMLVDARSAFESWIVLKLSKSQRKQWCVCFFAMIWSVWEARNKIIFYKQASGIDRCTAILWQRWQVWSNTWCC